MNNIKEDIIEQFNSTRNNIKTQLDKEFDIDGTILHLSDYIPKEIMYNCEVLLETILSYLMKDAKKAIENFDVKTKNRFYDEKINEKIIEFANSLKENKNLINNAIEFQKDKRKLNAIIASGLTFIAGGVGIMAVNPTSIIGLIVSGIVVIIVSAFVFKSIYKKETIKKRDAIREDVENYLKQTEKEVDIWLNEVAVAFNKELQSFITQSSNLNQVSK